MVTENDKDQEIDFIEEIVTDYQQDVDLQELIYTIVKSALDDKKSFGPDDKEEILAGFE